MRLNERFAGWAMCLGALTATQVLTASHADAAVVNVTGTYAKPAKATGGQSYEGIYYGTRGGTGYTASVYTDTYVFDGAIVTGGDGADVSGTRTTTGPQAFQGGYGGLAVNLAPNPATLAQRLTAVFNSGTYTGGNGGNANVTGGPNSGGQAGPALITGYYSMSTLNGGTFAGGTGGSAFGVSNGLRAYGIAVSGPMVVNGGTIAGLYVDDANGKVEVHGGRFTTGTYTDGYTSFTAGLDIAGGGLVNVYGSNFSVDGMPVGPGVVALPSGTLRGVLENDTVASDISFINGGTLNLINVPEPTSLGLLTAAGGLLTRRSRRRD